MCCYWENIRKIIFFQRTITFCFKDVNINLRRICFVLTSQRIIYSSLISKKNFGVLFVNIPCKNLCLGILTLPLVVVRICKRYDPAVPQLSSVTLGASQNFQFLREVQRYSIYVGYHINH